MKNRKRWLSVILSVVLTIAMCVTTAMAVDADGAKPTITVETKTGTFNVNDEVALNVSISNNPGFAGFSFGVVYDAEKLQLTEIGKGSFDGIHTPHPKKNTVVFANTTDSANDGLMFTLKFKVIADCSDGAKVSVEKNEIKNVAGKEIATLIVSGGLNVTPGSGGSTTGGSTTGGSTTGGSTTGGSTTGGSTTGGSTTGGSTTGGSTTGGSTTGGSTTGGTPGGDPIPDYKVIEGANSTWTVNSDGTVTVRSNGDFAKFTGIEMDGIAVAPKNYDAKSGSTIVTLHKDYLATLSVGTHTLTFVFEDGTCSTGLTIKPTGSTVEVTVPSGNTTTPGNASNPGTGANDAVGVAAALAVISLLGASAVICKK